MASVNVLAFEAKYRLARHCPLNRNLYTNRYNPALREIYWVASAKDDLGAMPEAVQDVFGYALHLAQSGSKHPDAKPLQGFGGAGVLEVVESQRGNAYRAVYTLKIAGRCSCFTAFKRSLRRAQKRQSPIWNSSATD